MRGPRRSVRQELGIVLGTGRMKIRPLFFPLGPQDYRYECEYGNGCTLRVCSLIMLSGSG